MGFGNEKIDKVVSLQSYSMARPAKHRTKLSLDEAHKQDRELDPEAILKQLKDDENGSETEPLYSKSGAVQDYRNIRKDGE